MKSIRAFLFAPVLVLAAIALLSWNEGRAVRTARALSEGSRSVVSTDLQGLSGLPDGALVHITGQAEAGTSLRDEVLGLEVPVLRLVRDVEMRQWRRVNRNEDDVTYEQTWSAQLIESTNFPAQYQNPAALPVGDASSTSQNAMIGSFSISPTLLVRSRDLQPLTLSDEQIYAVEDRLGVFDIQRTDTGIYLPYGYGEVAAPAIGDVRLNLEVLPAGQVSLVARKAGSVLDLYTARSGVAVGFFRTGAHSAQAMFDDAVRQNNALTAALRVFGFVLMALGFRMLFSPLAALTGWIPLVGSLTKAGLALLAGALALCISVVTIAVAWLAFRPLISVPAIAIAVAAAVMLMRRKPSAAAATGRVQAPAAASASGPVSATAGASSLGNVSSSVAAPGGTTGPVVSTQQTASNPNATNPDEQG